MSGIAQGRSLELYYIDGRPDGMLTAEMFNWTGHVLVTPRTRLKDALARTEAKYTGVYILLGEQNGEPLAYIGEAEELSSRIKTHETSKDWWTLAVLVTSTAKHLNKAHVKYLESRLVEKAKAIGTTQLANANTPPRPSLTEASQANMEAFLDYLLMVLPAVRVDLFVQKVRPKIHASLPVSEPHKYRPLPTFEDVVRFHLTSAKHKVTASAILDDGEFVVEAGSLVVSKPDDTVGSHSYVGLRRQLLDSGVIAATAAGLCFQENYAFSSPSAAAAVILGFSVNGTIYWKTETGKTYKAWEAEQLAATTPSGRENYEHP